MIVTGLLISRSADALYRTDKLGRTCLHFASAHGYSDMILMLLSQGAEVNAIDKVTIFIQYPNFKKKFFHF